MDSVDGVDGVDGVDRVDVTAGAELKMSTPSTWSTPPLALYYPPISKLVFHSVNSAPDPLAASCKLGASVSLSRS